MPHPPRASPEGDYLKGNAHSRRYHFCSPVQQMSLRTSESHPASWEKKNLISSCDDAPPHFGAFLLTTEPHHARGNQPGVTNATKERPGHRKWASEPLRTLRVPSLGPACVSPSLGSCAKGGTDSPGAGRACSC